MFASLCSTPELRSIPSLPDVEDTHTAVVQPHSQQVGVVRMDVYTHDTAGSGVDKSEEKREERGRERGEG